MASIYYSIDFHFRGLFIISPTGIVRSFVVNDFPVGRSVDEAIRLVEAFQFTDEHGAVCSLNRKPKKEKNENEINGKK